jgi:hypothetical protein
MQMAPSLFPPPLFAASSVFFVENAARAGAAGKYLTFAATFFVARSKIIFFSF